MVTLQSSLFLTVIEAVSPLRTLICGPGKSSTTNLLMVLLHSLLKGFISSCKNDLYLYLYLNDTLLEAGKIYFKKENSSRSFRPFTIGSSSLHEKNKNVNNQDFFGTTQMRDFHLQADFRLSLYLFIINTSIVKNENI